jgi:pyridoxal phosphate enzyme (YggS family)
MEDIRLMAVTKGFDRAVVESALALGMSLFGENRVQEAENKYLDLSGGFELHLIGHLQRNKARAAAGLFRCVQSIDGAATAAALESRCAESGRTMDILLELNTSGEPSKSGFTSRGALSEFLDGLPLYPHLRAKGLMTVGPLTSDTKEVRAAFADLREAFEDIRSSAGLPGFNTLSMGMSGDFETAIEEGATLVRIGSALFGPRGQR